jgi:hypothetical protein
MKKINARVVRSWKTTVIGLVGIALGIYLIADKKAENNMMGYGSLVGGLFFFFLNDLSSWAEFKKITPFRVAGAIVGITAIVFAFLGKDWTFVGGMLAIAAGLFGGKFGTDSPVNLPPNNNVPSPQSQEPVAPVVSPMEPPKP